MIISHRVKVKWSGSTRKHYEKLGYKYTKKDEGFYVMSTELTRGSNIKIKYKCDFCGEEGLKRFDAIMVGRESLEKDCCAKCAPVKHNEVLLMKYGSLESKYPEIAKEWSERNKLNPSEVTPSSGKRVEWVCCEGHMWSAAIYSRVDTGCPICRESKGEKRVTQVLESLNVKYRREVSISDLKGTGGGLLRYDFAITDSKGIIKAFIEYDGPFHFESIYEGDRHEITVAHDKMKNEYCEKIRIPLFRIPYTEYENIPNKIEYIMRGIESAR